MDDWLGVDMADSTDAERAGEEPGPATRAVLADAATAAAATTRAYRAFLTHAQSCVDCRTTGADCETAADLRQIWRATRTAA